MSLGVIIGGDYIRNRGARKCGSCNRDFVVAAEEHSSPPRTHPDTLRRDAARRWRVTESTEKPKNAKRAKKKYIEKGV
jgi:hypothetical protein